MQQGIPPGTVLLIYRVLDERAVVWVVSREAVDMSELRAPAARLEALVERLRGYLQRRRRPEEIRRLAAEIASALLPDPVLDLPSGTALVFIPDKALYQVPFAGLVDPGSGRYLVEDHTITTAPSIALYLDAIRRSSAPEEAPPPAGALVVSDPAFSRRLFPGIPALAAARKEGDAVAAVYPGAVHLSGDRATKAAVLEAVGHVSILHFAGHALIDGADPGRSGLLLAPPAPAPREASSSLLAAGEIQRSAALGSMRLVVLAACSTAVGYYPGGEEVASLAAAFLAAGVPAVVATTWEMEDAAGRRFSALFHNSLAAGESPAGALRAAQLAMLADPDLEIASPASWAAFQLIGGVGGEDIAQRNGGQPWTPTR